jgi:hypothetical protein
MSVLILNSHAHSKEPFRVLTLLPEYKFGRVIVLHGCVGGVRF